MMRVILQEAGFGAPHVRWNELNETTCLIGNLRAGNVYIDNGAAVVGIWPVAS